MSEQVDIKPGRRVSGIWAIPILALVLGVYMLIQQVLTEGPEVQIAFKTASGLEPGKTKVKFRDMNMGVVEQVRLNENLDGVIADVKLSRQATSLLREDTHFWVVTARVGVSSITGLDTLVSGAYIQLSPGQGAQGRREYIALERPPATPTSAAGLRLHLTSERASSVSAGDEVLYNGYTVGRVEKMDFRVEDRKAHYEIFIDAPYHELVNSSVRFWDVSGISLKADAEGVAIETGSLYTVLLGGVAFGIPAGMLPGAPVDNNSDFILYDSRAETEKNPYRYGSHYVVNFSQSMKGLSPGAPVEYRGIPIGRVERILLKESMEKAVGGDGESAASAIPVLIFIEPGRVELPDQESSIQAFNKLLIRGVKRGLRASLDSGNLLTGAKYVNIDYFSNVEEASMGSHGDFATIPTVDTGLAQVQQKLVTILDKVNALPLDDTVNSANAVMAKLDATLGSLHSVIEKDSTQQLTANVDRTLNELSETLKGFSPDSNLYRSASDSMIELNRTLNNLEALTRILADKPSALILPSEAAPDELPRAKER